jgi:hypothetical protein
MSANKSTTSRNQYQFVVQSPVLSQESLLSKFSGSLQIIARYFHNLEKSTGRTTCVFFNPTYSH